MKKIIFPILALSLIIGSSCKEKIDIEKEQAAILAVIEEERSAFFDSDLPRTEATWIQEPTSRKYYMSSARIYKMIGWSEISKVSKEEIEGDMRDDYENINAEYSNFDIVVHDNTALVFHDTQWSGKYLGEEINLEQERILHLVKVEGKWKLDLMAIYNIPKEEVDDDDDDENDDDDDEPETEE